LPDKRLLAVPRSETDRERAFPSKQAAGWGNATFLALCMKVAYEVSLPQPYRRHSVVVLKRTGMCCN
jgi:hypothetical protein